MNLWLVYVLGAMCRGDFTGQRCHVGQQMAGSRLKALLRVGGRMKGAALQAGVSARGGSRTVC